MADPLSTTLGALSIVQTCINVTKIFIATKQVLISITNEADDTVKELSGLKSVCESVHHICEKIKGDYGSPALSTSDAIRTRELCGRLALSVEDCNGYMDQLEMLSVRVSGTTDIGRNRKSVVMSAIKQFLKKDELQEIRGKIFTHRSNIQGELACLSSFCQFNLVEYSKQSLKTMSIMNASINTIQNSMQSSHSIIDQYLQPAIKSPFQLFLFSVRSIQLVISGTRYYHRDNILDKLDIIADTRLRESRPQEENRSSYKGSDRAFTLASAQTVGRVMTSNEPQVEDLPSKSETRASVNKIFNVPYPPVSGFVGRKKSLAD